MRRPNPTLTPQELAIMKELWALEEATVRDIYERLRQARPVAYTTVLTMMKILEQKGYVRKTLVDRAHVYKPARPRQQVVGAMIRDFVERVFDGASRPLLVHLVKDTRLSEKQRAAILRMIDEAEP
jgi:BlaI family transcriptional regulator, penicillinase repressor